MNPAATRTEEASLLLAGSGLTETAVPLSATGLSGMAAAILKIYHLEPIVAQQQPHFPGPRLRTAQVGKKSPGTGTGSFFLTHGHCSRRLKLGVNVPGGVSDGVQFHAIVHFCLGGLFDALEGVQRTKPLVAGAILHLHKALAAFRLLPRSSFLSFNIPFLGFQIACISHLL
jgi:hypothetical protein